jgi:CrcB protein
MSQIFAIAGGGAVGAVLRYWVSNAVYALSGRGFPYGTLAVNVIGSMVMGFLFVWLLERMSNELTLRAFLLIGLLGAFTTFSTFSVETLNLIEAGQLGRAVANVLVSVVLCVSAAAIGVMLARQL